jgi:hypothetical protein
MLAVKRLPTRHQRDGLKKKAGDEARTRDSLLGRQELTRTLPKSWQSACQADLPTFSKFLSKADKSFYDHFLPSPAKKVRTIFPFFPSYH